MSLPFKCGMCGNYCNELQLTESSEKCDECGKNVCVFFQIRSIDRYAEMRGYFPDLPEQAKEGEYEVVRGEQCTKEEVPGYGLIVILEEKKKEVEKFRRIWRKGRELLMVIRKKEAKEEYNVVGEIEDEDFIRKLLTKNLLIKVNNEEVKKDIIMQFQTRSCLASILSRNWLRSRF